MAKNLDAHIYNAEEVSALVEKIAGSGSLTPDIQGKDTANNAGVKLGSDTFGLEKNADNVSAATPTQNEEEIASSNPDTTKEQQRDLPETATRENAAEGNVAENADTPQQNGGISLNGSGINPVGGSSVSASSGDISNVSTEQSTTASTNVSEDNSAIKTQGDNDPDVPKDPDNPDNPEDPEDPKDDTSQTAPDVDADIVIGGEEGVEVGVEADFTMNESGLNAQYGLDVGILGQKIAGTSIGAGLELGENGIAVSPDLGLSLGNENSSLNIDNLNISAQGELAGTIGSNVNNALSAASDATGVDIPTNVLGTTIEISDQGLGISPGIDQSFNIANNQIGFGDDGVEITGDLAGTLSGHLGGLTGTLGEATGQDQQNADDNNLLDLDAPILSDGQSNTVEGDDNDALDLDLAVLSNNTENNVEGDDNDILDLDGILLGNSSEDNVEGEDSDDLDVDTSQNEEGVSAQTDTDEGGIGIDTSDTENPVDIGVDTADEVVEELSDVADDILDPVAEDIATDDATDTVEEVVDTAEDTVEEVLDSADDTVDNVVDLFNDNQEDGTDDAATEEDSADSSDDTANNTIDDVVDTVDDTANDLLDDAGGLLGGGGLF